MNKIKINIWNRNFTLPISLECYDGEQVLPSQSEADEWIKSNDKEIEKSLKQVEQYILENDSDKLIEKQVNNIFKYVKPKKIFIPHCKKPTVAIICNYKFDNEHGLVVIFENGKFKKVDSQDASL